MEGNEWIAEVEKLRKENAQLKDDVRILKNIRSIRTEERDRYKTLYEDLLSTNEVLKDMTRRLQDTIQPFLPHNRKEELM